MENIIYLDTHVIVWLYAGKTDLLSLKAKHEIQENDILISPIVELEVQYLYETDRITGPAKEVIDFLIKTIDLKICDHNFSHIIDIALEMDWTRDPFDRIITAQASIEDSLLLTKDQSIHTHYKNAVWE